MTVKFGEIHLILPKEERDLFLQIKELLERSIELDEKILLLTKEKIEAEELDNLIAEAGESG